MQSDARLYMKITKLVESFSIDLMERGRWAGYGRWWCGEGVLLLVV
jgi:hypothetical protein